MFHFKGFEEPSKLDFARLKRDISSWSKTSDIIYKTNDPMEVYRVLFVERKSRSRPYNLSRIYQRFNRLRCNEELRALSSFLEEVPIDEDLKQHLKNQTKLNIFLDIVDPSMDLYLRLLKIEHTRLNRPYMIRLLHGRFQKLRREEEILTL